MNNSLGMNYESPIVQVIEITIEKGFALSSGTKSPTISGWADGGEYDDSFNY